MEGSHRSSARQMKRGQHQGRSPGSLRALGTKRGFYQLSGRTEQATPRIKKLQPWKPRQGREVFNNWKENGFQPWIWCPANLGNQELEKHKSIFPTSKFSENSPPWALFLRKDAFLYSRDKATEADRKWQIWPRTEGNHRWWCQRALVRARSQVWGEMSPDWGQARRSWGAEEEETERIYLMHPNDARGCLEH